MHRSLLPVFIQKPFQGFFHYLLRSDGFFKQALPDWIPCFFSSLLLLCQIPTELLIFKFECKRHDLLLLRIQSLDFFRLPNIFQFSMNFKCKPLKPIAQAHTFVFIIAIYSGRRNYFQNKIQKIFPGYLGSLEENPSHFFYERSGIFTIKIS